MESLRTEKLTDRKPELKHLMAKVPESRTRYADDIEQYGRALFQPVCEMDLGALWPSIGTRLTPLSARRGSRIVATLKHKVGKNYLSGNAIRTCRWLA